MSNRSLIELNHDYTLEATDEAALLEWAREIHRFMRTLEVDDLPLGITYYQTRHHEDKFQVERFHEFQSERHPTPPPA